MTNEVVDAALLDKAQTAAAQAAHLQNYNRTALSAAEHLVRNSFELANWSPYVDWASRLQGEGVIYSPAVVQAFQRIPRYNFMPDAAKPGNSSDGPVGIGYGQTISQPSTVGRMQEWLQLRRGQRVLDVGSGSGWTTALTRSVVGASGSVLGVERVPELVASGQANVAKYFTSSVEIKLAGETLGMPEKGPFNRILVSAHLPEAWLGELQEQLSPHGGRLIAPIVSDEGYAQEEFDNSMVSVTRHGRSFEREELATGFAFVPIVKESVS